MVDPVAVAFFRQQLEKDRANGRCADMGTEGADWASITHGIYLNIGASGIHRSMGVKVSFVQSTTMDSWKPLHLRMMELGGNRRFMDFMQEQGVPDDLPLRQKYRTRAAAWYRAQLRALAEEAEPPEPLPPGTGHLPTEEVLDAATAKLDEVFAAAPCRGEMTEGGVPVAKPRPFATAGHHRQRRSRKVSSFPGWVSKQFDKMTTSKGARAAEKLQQMSTGSMPGFGPGDVSSTSLPPRSQAEESSPGASSSASLPARPSAT